MRLVRFPVALIALLATLAYIALPGGKDAEPEGVTAADTAPASALSYNSVADAYVSSAYPATKYGTRSILKVDASPRVRSYLRFIVRLPEGARVTGARLTLYTTSPSTSRGFSVSTVANTSWSETRLTYSNAPAIGSALGSSGPWSTRGYKSVSLPGRAVRPGVNAFALTTRSASSKTFHSREGRYKPRLAVTYALPQVSPPAARGPRIPEGGAYWGAYVNSDALNGQARQEVTDFEAMTGRKLRIGHHYRGWTENFPYSTADRADEGWNVANGRVPMISQDGSMGILDAINSGAEDGRIIDRARRIRQFGHPLFYRLFYEMNGDWMPYNEAHASTPGTHDGTEKYTRAWRRVHALFQQEGATNAAFVWCPNYDDNPDTPENHWRNYYPGDAYVDWVCADGYNRGTDKPWSTWQSFADIFRSVYADYPQKPFMVGETSSTENGGDKAQWIRDAHSYFKASMPRARAFLWFHRGLEPGSSDFRVDTSAESLQAYREMGADPYFNP